MDYCSEVTYGAANTPEATAAKWSEELGGTFLEEKCLSQTESEPKSWGLSHSVSLP